MRFKEWLIGILIKPAVWVVEHDYAVEKLEQEQFNRRMAEYERSKK